MSSSDPDSRMLLLLRHGKAEGMGEQDIDRDLTERGRQQARLIGDYLRAQGVRPSRVLVSPAARTRQTFEALASAMPELDARVDIVDGLYEGGAHETVQALRELPDEDRVVLVVGHEPTMSMLGHLLADEDSDSGALAQARIGISTGSMCVLTGPLGSWDELGEDSLTLHTIVRS